MIITKKILSGLALLLSMILFLGIQPALVVNAEGTETTTNESQVTTGSDASVTPPDLEQKNTTVTLREPLFDDTKTIDVSEGSLTILGKWVSMVYRFVLAFSTIVIVLVFMGAGFILMTSGGDTGARETAKELITKSLFGLVVLFLAGLFLYTINPNFYIFGGGESDLGEVQTVQDTP